MCPPTLPPTSITLLGRLRSPADQEAWADFVRCYGPAIYAWCRRWNLTHQDAEEVTQEVLVRLLDRLQRFRYDPAGSFRGWLRSVARSVCADFHESLRPLDRGTGSERMTVVLSSLPAREDFFSRLQEQFDLERLSRAMDRVRYRVQKQTWQAFCLQALEGKSGRETAAALDMTVSTAYVALHRVLTLLGQEVNRLERRIPVG